MAKEEIATEEQVGESDKTVDVEERLAKLEKIYEQTNKDLESEKKASSSKDKKIAELQGERKKLQEATLSKDDLLKLREEELSKKEEEWEKTRETEKQELERLKQEHMKSEVLSKLDEFPRAFWDRIKGDTPEEVETDARRLMKIFLTERDKIGNAYKVTKRPQTAEGKPMSLPLVADYAKWTTEQRRRWAEKASKEERDAMEKEISESE